jgi:hypothetical protein
MGIQRVRLSRPEADGWQALAKYANAGMGGPSQVVLLQYFLQIHTAPDGQSFIQCAAGLGVCKG